ncbi:MAG: PDZ domain-containing protein [Gemmatimonadaceae bacterium]
MRQLLLLSVVAATAAASTLNAQVAPAKPDSACTTYPDGRVECRVYRSGVRGDSAMRVRSFYRNDSTMAKRAALGLQLRSTGTRRDTLGVFVEAVTPKGPAENAGIVEGDRIAAINGVDVRASAADTEDDYTSGLASHRLSREVQKLTPGNRVTLRVYSGGRFRDVQVTAGRASDVMRLGTRAGFMIPRAGGMMRFNGPGAMMFGPDMPMMRERLEPLMRERIEPLMRQRLRHLPERIQMRAPMDFDDDWFDDDWFDVDDEIEPVSADVIRDLVAITIRDARSALERLAAAGIV